MLAKYFKIDFNDLTCFYKSQNQKLTFYQHFNKSKKQMSLGQRDHQPDYGAPPRHLSKKREPQFIHLFYNNFKLNRLHVILKRYHFDITA